MAVWIFQFPSGQLQTLTPLKSVAIPFVFSRYRDRLVLKVKYTHDLHFYKRWNDTDMDLKRQGDAKRQAFGDTQGENGGDAGDWTFEITGNEVNGPLVENVYALSICPQNCESDCLAATGGFQWIFSGGSDGVVRRWDFFNSLGGKNLSTNTTVNAMKNTLPPTVTKLGTLVSSFDTRTAAVGMESASMAATKALKRPVSCIASHAQGVWVVTGHQDGAMHLWTVRVDNGSCQHTFKNADGGNTEPVSGIKLFKGEKAMASGSWDKSVRIWDLNTGANTVTLTGHTAQVSMIDAHPHDQLVVSSSVDGTVRVWDVRQSKCARQMDNGKNWQMSTCWSADALGVFSGRKDGTIEEWDVRQGMIKRLMQCDRQYELPVTAIRALPNGKQIACANRNGPKLMDVSREERTIAGYVQFGGHPITCEVSDILVDQDNQYMVTASGARGFGMVNAAPLDTHMLFYKFFHKDASLKQASIVNK